MSFLSKTGERGTVYHKSVIWRHKKTHSKVKKIVVPLVTEFSSSSLYFYFRSVFFAGDVQDRNPKRAEFFRVSISLFLHFQNRHIKHLFLLSSVIGLMQRWLWWIKTLKVVFGFCTNAGLVVAIFRKL